MKNLTPAQLRKIHALSRERGLNNDALHVYVETLTKRNSLKELTITEAIKVIDGLSAKTETVTGMMTDSQKRFMYGLAREIGWTDDNGAADERRLRGFIKECFKIESMKWLTSRKASQIIEALKAMKTRQTKGEQAI